MQLPRTCIWGTKPPVPQTVLQRKSSRLAFWAWFARTLQHHNHLRFYNIAVLLAASFTSSAQRNSYPVISTSFPIDRGGKSSFMLASRFNWNCDASVSATISNVLQHLMSLKELQWIRVREKCVAIGCVPFSVFQKYHDKVEDLTNWNQPHEFYFSVQEGVARIATEQICVKEQQSRILWMDRATTS